MKITFIDRIKIIFSIYSINKLLPNFKKRLALFIRPLDLTRYTEFAYFRKFIKKNNLKNLKILDISSPHLMSYVLSKNNNVIKTNIDESEKEFIKENKNLKFKIEDATNLSFEDNIFDIVYSISVIEHIYENYLKAIKEMIRVTKTGGYIYITFPVSETLKTEWVYGEVYKHQIIKNNETFFQYRFGEKEVENIINIIGKNEIMYKDIFWEKKSGTYNKIVEKLKRNLGNEYYNFLKNSIINLYFGFKIFDDIPENDFLKKKDFGNIHLIIKKK